MLREFHDLHTSFLVFNAGKFKNTRKGLFFLGEKADILSLSIVII